MARAAGQFRMLLILVIIDNIPTHTMSTVEFPPLQFVLVLFIITITLSHAGPITIR